MTPHRLGPILVLGLTLLGTAPAAAGPATDRLKGFITAANQVLEGPITYDNALEKLASIRKLVTDIGDWETAAARALGPEWKARTPAEQAEFAGLFAELIERMFVGVMASRARVEGGVGINWLGERKDGDEVVVVTAVQGRGSSAFTVDYRMARVVKGSGEAGPPESQWRIRDVTFDGVSLVENYRAQFQAVTRRSSYRTLLAEMHQRVAETTGTPTPPPARIASAPAPAEERRAAPGPASAAPPPVVAAAEGPRPAPRVPAARAGGAPPTAAPAGPAAPAVAAVVPAIPLAPSSAPGPAPVAPSVALADPPSPPGRVAPEAGRSAPGPDGAAQATATREKPEKPAAEKPAAAVPTAPDASPVRPLAPPPPAVASRPLPQPETPAPRPPVPRVASAPAPPQAPFDAGRIALRWSAPAPLPGSPAQSYGVVTTPARSAEPVGVPPPRALTGWVEPRPSPTARPAEQTPAPAPAAPGDARPDRTVPRPGVAARPSSLAGHAPGVTPASRPEATLDAVSAPRPEAAVQHLLTWRSAVAPTATPTPRPDTLRPPAVSAAPTVPTIGSGFPVASKPTPPPPSSSIRLSRRSEGELAFSLVLPKSDALVAAMTSPPPPTRVPPVVAPAANPSPEIVARDRAALAVMDVPETAQPPTRAAPPAAVAAPAPGSPSSRPPAVTKPATEPTVAVAAPTAAAEAARAAKEYWVQVGAYSSRQAAAKAAERLKTWTYQIVLGGSPASKGALARVMVGPFAQRAEATSALRDLQAQGFKGGFVVSP
jgi:ABC-type transporter MlaC component/cell division septation protein DedD